MAELLSSEEKAPQRWHKRSADVLTAAFLLVLTSPVFLVLAVTILAVMGRPIFFIQDRPGLHGHPFRMMKFRSMSEECGPDGQRLADQNRLGPFGRFLRSTSLDELPELINVLKGDMSIVGPRPLLMEYLPLYSAEQARRHEVRPGITGWAQVKGRNALSWKEKLALDVWYVDNRSFWLDLKIIALTVSKVLRREGISQTGHATMPAFQGEADDK